MDKYLIKRGHFIDDEALCLTSIRMYYYEVHHPLYKWTERLYKIDIRDRRYNGLIRCFKRPTLVVI